MTVLGDRFSRPVTLLLTDVEGSTRMMEEDADGARALLAEHDAIVARRTAAHGGRFVRDRSEGDSAFLVFDEPGEALRCALGLQRDLRDRPGDRPEIRVRMGLHVGLPHRRGDQLYGPVVNRCGAVRNLAHGGQVLLSGAVVALLGDDHGFHLRDLGRHRLTGLNDTEHIAQVVADDLPADFPPLRSPDEQRHNLPAGQPGFIGEALAREILGTVRAARLVTLVGPGGIGKSRLAMEVARLALDGFADGVWLVELGGQTDPERVADLVAAAVGVREQPGRPLQETVVGHVAAREVLLVLDGADGAAAPFVADLVRGPRVAILATGMSALGVAGETVRQVRPLAVPAVGADPEAAARAPAVQLFVERLRAAGQAAPDDASVVGSMAALCRRLDGIPLAIEVAAGRVASVAPDLYGAAFEAQLVELAAPTAPASDPVLAALAGGHADLPSEEQALFRRSSVFEGGFTLEAAEGVCADPEHLPEDLVLDALAGLAGRSLLLVDDQPGGLRYRTLQSVRAYGRDRLAAAAEAEDLADRHRQHFVALARTLDGTNLSDVVVLDAIEADHPNMLRALEARAGEPVDAQLWEAGHLAGFWELRGHWTLGLHVLEELLAGPTTLFHPKAVAAGEAARLAQLQGAYADAERLYDMSAAAWADLRSSVGAQQLDAAATAARLEVVDRGELAMLISRCELARLRGDLEAASRHGQDALAHARAVEDERLVLEASSQLGLIEFGLGRLDIALGHLRETADRHRRDEDDVSLARSQNNIGAVHWFRGEFGDARAHYAEALELSRRVGDRFGLASALHNLADVDLAQGRDGRAACEDSLALSRELEHPIGVGRTLALHAELAMAAGDLDTAAGDLVEAAEIMGELGDPVGIATVVVRRSRLARLLGAGAEHWVTALASALGTVEAAGDVVVAASCRAELALACAAAGDRPAAAGWLRTAAAAPTGMDVVDVEIVDAATVLLGRYDPDLAAGVEATADGWRLAHDVITRTVPHAPCVPFETLQAALAAVVAGLPVDATDVTA